MTIKKDLIWKTLRAAFPDPVIEVTELTVDLAINAMQMSWRPEFEAAFGIVKPAAHVTALLNELDPGAITAQTDGVFYIGHAAHRREAPITDAFVAHLPHVRVRLPETGEPAIGTAGGVVYAGDHLLYNLEMIRDYLADQAILTGKTYSVRRVDVITPARFAGSRFAAIALHLLYRQENDIIPWGYILEAGMATGQPRTAYFSPGWHEPIVRRSYYQPTPDSSPKHFYRGQLTLNTSLQADGELLANPAKLVIEAFRTNPETDESAAPYHVTTVTYESVASPGMVIPALLTLQAACRVALIEQTMGRELPDVGPLTFVLAELGKQLPWDLAPTQLELPVEHPRDPLTPPPAHDEPTPVATERTLTEAELAHFASDIDRTLSGENENDALQHARENGLSADPVPVDVVSTNPLDIALSDALRDSTDILHTTDLESETAEDVAALDEDAENIIKHKFVGSFEGKPGDVFGEDPPPRPKKES